MGDPFGRIRPCPWKRTVRETLKDSFDLDLLIENQPGWRRRGRTLELSSKDLADHAITALLKADGKFNK